MRTSASAVRTVSGLDVVRAPTGRTMAGAVGAYLVLAVILAALVSFSHDNFSAGEYTPDYEVTTPHVLEGWYQFDAGWYDRIATRGYDHVPDSQSPVAFFPAYPLAIRAVSPLVGGNEGAAGTLVTFLCGIVSVALFALWSRDHLEARAVPWAIAALLLFPYSWYLVGAVYADALFLAAGLAAFVLLERDRPLLAGLAGAVASGARPVGPAVVLGLVVVTLERRGALVPLAARTPALGVQRQRAAATSTKAARLERWRSRLRTWLVGLGAPRSVNWRRLRSGDGWVLLSAGGFVAYSGYLWVRFGDPLLFNSVQRYWDQPSGPATWVKAHLWGNILLNFADKPRYLLGCLFQGALTVSAILLVPRLIRRFGWGYGLLVFALMGVPLLGSKDFQGTGRYLLAAFPLFALAGEWLADRPPRVRGAVLATSAALLLLWTHLYARGFYVA